MSKKLQLQIPTPCHENWDSMTPVEKDRFCGSCQKQVVDFSDMSDREIAMFFRRPSTGSVCGRFMQDQLNRDIEIPGKRIPWVKYFFQFLVPGFLLSMKATAQEEEKLMKKNSVKAVCSNPNKGKPNGVKPLIGDTLGMPGITLICNSLAVGKVSLGQVTTSLNKIDSTIIKGRIITNEGTPVSFASVMIKGTFVGTASDSIGNFSMKPKSDWKNLTLVFSCVGYEVIEKEVYRNEYPGNVNIEMIVMKSMLMGMLIRPTNKKNRETKNVPLFKRIFKDIAFNNFKIFPNPVKSNSSLNIQWKQTEAGYYILQLFNQSGQLVFTKEMYIDEEARLLSVDLPLITAGSYFLRMTNKQSNKSYTEKIIVQ